MTHFYARLGASLLFIGACLLAISAKANESVALVRHGTSYGECIGYCLKDIEVFSSRVSFRAMANHPTKKLPTISNEVALAKQDQVELLRLLAGVSVEGLAERIGCPDCSDGGAEWIEINRNGQFKRITFEKGQPPSQLKALTNWLAAVQDKFPVPSVR
jgi:hypothetical protein